MLRKLTWLVSFRWLPYAIGLYYSVSSQWPPPPPTGHHHHPQQQPTEAITGPAVWSGAGPGWGITSQANPSSVTDFREISPAPSFPYPAARSTLFRLYQRHISSATYVVSVHIHPVWERHSSGAVWESRWTSWAVRPNEPSGFRGRKELLNRASALVTTCP